MSTDNLPAPYPRNPGGPVTPWTLQCDAIDDAAALIRDPDAFAEVAKSDRVLDPDAEFHSEAHAFFEKPDGPFIRHFTEEGGCPAFRGILNAGSTANVLCDLTTVQLHNYCQVKFCEKGRKAYCPIWRARGGADNDN